MAIEFFDPPEGWAESVCGVYQPVFDSVSPGGPPPPTGPLRGQPPEISGPGALIPSLGLLSGPMLLEMAGPMGSGFPSPGSSGGGCPGQGGPLLSGTEGSVIVGEGRVCGVLVVEGDLTLKGDTRFQGLALVGGDLVLEGEATFEGMARIRGGLFLRDPGTLEPRACPVLWSLERVLELRRPLPLPEGGKLTGF